MMTARFDGDDVLTDGRVRVMWDELGEGQSGDFDPDDPDDVELLRFSVHRFEGDDAMLSHDAEDPEFAQMLAVEGLGWREVDDASYCTQVPVTTPGPERRRLLTVIMAGVRDRIVAGLSVKRDCEVLSWIAPSVGTDDLDDRIKDSYGRKLGAITERETSAVSQP